MILATGGVRVMKHGTCGATSASGTADIQEALDSGGLDQNTLADVIEEISDFFFARDFHPAFKHIVPVRQASQQ